MTVAEKTALMLHDTPAVGKLLAWFVWINVDSPSTAVVGLALMGLGFFSKSDDNVPGTVSGPGFHLSGTVRHLMMGAGFLIYFVGGPLNAGRQHESALANQSTLASFNLSN